MSEAAGDFCQGLAAVLIVPLTAAVVLSGQDIAYDPKQHEVLSLGLTAEVTDAWWTTDPQIVFHLDSFHLYSRGFAKSRLTLKGKQTITIILLRCRILKHPLQLQSAEHMYGCFSWVDLNKCISSQNSGEVLEPVTCKPSDLLPCLSDEDFQLRRHHLRSKIDEFAAEKSFIETSEVLLI